MCIIDDLIKKVEFEKRVINFVFWGGIQDIVYIKVPVMNFQNLFFSKMAEVSIKDESTTPVLTIWDSIFKKLLPLQLSKYNYP